MSDLPGVIHPRVFISTWNSVPTKCQGLQHAPKALIFAMSTNKNLDLNFFVNVNLSLLFCLGDTVCAIYLVFTTGNGFPVLMIGFRNKYLVYATLPCVQVAKSKWQSPCDNIQILKFKL